MMSASASSPQPNFGQQPNFGVAPGPANNMFGQQSGFQSPSPSPAVNIFGQQGLVTPQSPGMSLNLGNSMQTSTMAVQANPVPFNQSGSPPSSSNLTESTAVVVHTGAKEAAPVKTIVSIPDVNMEIRSIEVVKYRGGQMVRGIDGKMQMMNYNNPVAIKVVAPEKKAVTGRTKKSKPGTETKEADNKPKDPNYWITGIQYNYGTETAPQWGKGLSYTFGQGYPVWFSPVAEEITEYEEAGEGGQSKTTKQVSYKTSCRLVKSSTEGQAILKFYDDLRIILSLALKSPANGSPAADAIGLAEMDPSGPKDTEIRRFYNMRMDNGVPDPTVDPTKYCPIASFKDKITASFVRPTIVHGMLLHKSGNQHYLLDNKQKAFFACDKDGRFTQIDPNTQLPTPIPATNFAHGTIAPEYSPMDPLSLKNKEFLGIPVIQMTGFYTSSGKASAQEKIRGMIVLDVRESQKGAQVKELGGTFDFTGNSEIDYASVAERFNALGINADLQSAQAHSAETTMVATAPAGHHLDNFTGEGGFN